MTTKRNTNDETQTGKQARTQTGGNVLPFSPRSRAELRDRSVALASGRGQTACSWSARTRDWTLAAGTGALVDASWWIASATRDDVRYVVRYDAATDDATCECAAAFARAACWHRGLAIIKGRALRRLYSPEGRAAARREARRDRAQDENAHCLGF